MHASCTCFMFIFVLGFSWPIPRSDRLFTQLCASWEYHEHALCLTMTWPCNSPMESAKLRFSLELLWRELLWWKLLWCSELLCALPALHPTSMRSNGQIINAKTPTQWLNANARKTASKHMLFCLFHRLMTKQTFLISSVKQITPNLSCETYSGQTYLNKCHDSQHRQNVWLIAGNCD